MLKKLAEYENTLEELRKLVLEASQLMMALDEEKRKLAEEAIKNKERAFLLLEDNQALTDKLGGKAGWIRRNIDNTIQILTSCRSIPDI